MNILDEIKAKAKANPRRVVLPESLDERTLRAVEIIIREGLAKPILLGDEGAIRQKAGSMQVNIEGAQFIDPNKFDKFEQYSQEFFKLRKHKNITIEKARETLKDVNYLGTMMVQMGDADGLVSGATHTTADTLRPALQIIKTHEKFHKVSSLFLMMLQDRLLVFADAAIEIDPDAKDLADIAIDTVQTAKKFGIQPKVAMLSFSTNGSATHPSVEKVQEAVARVKYRMPELIIDGEMQVDAALVPEVSERKFPGSTIKGDANVLIFPNLEAANIAYKLVERLAKAQAIGPIVQGLKKPVNDLSRGCSVQDIVDVVAITAVESLG
jgi:phosphate acetyltransferase